MLFGCVDGFLTATGRTKPELGFWDRVATVDNDATREQLLQDKVHEAGVIFAIACVGLPAFLLGALLPPKPWAHTYGVVLLCISLPLCITIKFAIPLLIYWLKPNAKAYFHC